MVSRRDQLLSYQFTMQRVISALVYRRTDSHSSPFRKAGGAYMAGAALTVLVLGITTLIGWFGGGGSTSWQEGGTVVVEKETGAVYVVLQYGENDFVLHPAVNYTSAVLAAGSNNTTSVKASSFVDIERGTPIGIYGAPEFLVEDEQLLEGAWSACSTEVPTARASSIDTFVYVSETPTGTNLGETSTLVITEEDNVYLLWNGYRHHIPNPETVLDVLLVGSEPRPTTEAFLQSIPSGVPVQMPWVPDIGDESPIDEVPVGQVLVRSTQAGDDQHFVVMSDGVAEVTTWQAELLLNNSDIRDDAYVGETPQVIAYPPGAPTDSSSRTLIPGTENAPGVDTERIPPVANADTDTVCASYSSGSSVPTISVDNNVDVEAGMPTRAQTAANTALADRIIVPPGQAAVVRVAITPEAGMGALYLVTDVGEAYPIAHPDVAATLGYTNPSSFVAMPAGLVGLIPVGPNLDPSQARQPAALGG
ncbi:type VII secretion protein EccB [Natronoglycomyces albus]|uniref:Type VII secretion protein EccB n=1 Tax=Natronoglycomyces albus TaxID=2811108 RepID=A0A895XMV6_9ACTN|nr:type VII secretion protein EccB [Natronoglycomyces albus]QSB04863.1 type VII secretion protein EccB [Natronoglycomyces albus]